MQTAAASRMPLGPLEYPQCLIEDMEDKRPSLFLATENRLKPILQIDESLLRSVPIDPFDAARTKKRKALSVQGAVNALRKSSAATIADTHTIVPAVRADQTLDIDPDEVQDVEDVAASLTPSASIASLAVPRKTSLNVPRIQEPVATPAPVAVAPLAHPAPAPIWSSEVRLRAAAPQAFPTPAPAPYAASSARSSSMPPPVVMSMAPQAFPSIAPLPGARTSSNASSTKVGLVIGSAVAFLAVAAGVFAMSFQLGAGSASKASAVGATRSERVTRVVDPAIRVAAPERVPTISVSMLPRAAR